MVWLNGAFRSFSVSYLRKNERSYTVSVRFPRLHRRCGTQVAGLPVTMLPVRVGGRAWGLTRRRIIASAFLPEKRSLSSAATAAAVGFAALLGAIAGGKSSHALDSL
eukprot:scaffold5370_cov249-Pinguiococcus_pyrenoidosus.AAC.1